MQDASATRKDIDELIGIMRDFMQQVDERFNQVDARFDILEKEVGETRHEVSGLQKSQEGLVRITDAFVKWHGLAKT